MMNIILAKVLIVLFFVVWVVSAVKFDRTDDWIASIVVGFFSSIIAIGMIVFCIQLILFLFWG